MAVTVVDLLEVVEVEEDECEWMRAEGLACGQSMQERAPVQQAREWIVIGEELRLGELRGDGKCLHCMVREDPERLQNVVVGQQPVSRLVGPAHAAAFFVGAVEGYDEPMMVPGEWPFPIQDGLVD